MRSGRHLFFCLFVAACAILATSQPAKAGVLFFSTSNSISGTVSVGSPVLNFPSPVGTGTLYIWVTDNTPVTPPPDNGNASAAALAVQIQSSGPAATMSSAQAYNVTLHSTIASSGTDLGPTTQNRWDVVTVMPAPPNPEDLNAIVISTTTQAGAGSPGINPLNDGVHLNPGSTTNGTLDPGYNIASHAFLYGEIDFSLLAPGTSTIALQASPLGIIAGNQDLSSQFTYGSATINVVPEPASIALLGTGGLLMLARWRRCSSQ